MSEIRRKARSGALDAVLGGRLRARRRELGLSQKALADAVGLTFQQLQKYESGQNRIAASTLVRLSAALRLTPASLLDGKLDGAVAGAAPAPDADDAEALNAAYARIQSAELRAAVLQIIKALADPPAGGLDGASVL